MAFGVGQKDGKCCLVPDRLAVAQCVGVTKSLVFACRLPDNPVNIRICAVLGFFAHLVAGFALVEDFLTGTKFFRIRCGGHDSSNRIGKYYI